MGLGMGIYSWPEVRKVDRVPLLLLPCLRVITARSFGAVQLQSANGHCNGQ